MLAALSIIDQIFNIIQKLNLGLPAALVLYRNVEALITPGGPADPLPTMDDAAVILLFKQRADRGEQWIDEELARVNALIAEQGASAPVLSAVNKD